MAFPSSLTALRPTIRLEEISTEGELMWTASVLSLYTDKLRQFVKLRDDYCEAYLVADYGLAEDVLNRIQNAFGYSLWLLGNRLQLLQVTKGLKAQKTFLEEVLATDGINQFIAWLTYLLSVRAEENVSYSSFEAEIWEVLTTPWIRDYARLHLLPTDCASIENFSLPMAIEEPHPIIDRFETFVAMSLLYCSNLKGHEYSDVLSALELIESVDDKQINRILMVLRNSYCSDDSKFLQFADAYTEGRYEDVLVGCFEGMELISRSRALLGSPPPARAIQSMSDQIIMHMYSISTLSAEASLSRQKLKKLALINPDRSKIIEISDFLERTPDYMGTGTPSRLEVAAALSKPLDNPWSATAIDTIMGRSLWLSRLYEAHPTSSSIRLRFALTSGDSRLIEDTSMHLPPHRRSMYLGHINFKCGQFESAVAHYLSASTSEIEFISHAAKRSLFKAYYASGHLHDAVQLVIDQLLQFPSAASSYPLETLAKQYLNCENSRSSIDLAVLIHLAIRHGNAKLERDLSNIYENVLVAAELEKPSDFSKCLDAYDPTRLIYFLRHVCVPRILDDTTCFESVEEIDTERIAVCQLLLSLDEANFDTYQAEIRTITRDFEVATLLSKMQTSKIYVDEAGIRESLEVKLNEPLSRYLKLLDSPALAYQAEKLSKRIVEMLTNQGHPEFRDLRLPATELEGLFNAMRLEAADEFALNPAFGLDTHVSTSIRHGAFEGHLRRPLAMEDLICSKKDKEYILPPTWIRKLPELGPEDLANLQKILGRFTQRYEELIAEYLKGKLHISMGVGEVAMFVFDATPAEVIGLKETITPNTNVHDLSERLIAHCWSLTSRSLDAIRQDLLDYAAKQMYLAFDLLVRGGESKMEHSEVAPFIDAVARARTGFQTALEDVAGWFQRPTDLSRDPFDIEVATKVALQQIANCYVGSVIHPCLDLQVEQKIDGRMLDGLCEILFIFLQNVIRHSGFCEDRADVNLSAQRQENTLILRCANKLATDVSIAKRRECAIDAVNLYERDSALRMARKEGGSGLSKVWRIAEFDLRVRHSIELSVSDDGEFVVQLSLAGVWS
jgi:hypothetical protein